MSLIGLGLGRLLACSAAGLRRLVGFLLEVTVNVHVAILEEHVVTDVLLGHVTQSQALWPFVQAFLEKLNPRSPEDQDVDSRGLKRRGSHSASKLLDVSFGEPTNAMRW